MPEEIPTGKIIGEPNAVYHARDAIGSTRLRLFAKSPLRYYQTYISGLLPKKRTGALGFGVAFHATMEGGSAFDEACVLQQYDNYRSSAAQEWREAVESTGRVVVSHKDAARLSAMKVSVLKHPTAGPLYLAAEREVTWRAKIGGFYVQARTDGWLEGGHELTGGQPAFLDYKTVPSLLEDDFARDAANYGYAFQLSFYRQVVALVNGQTPPRAFIVACESEAPFECQVFEFDSDSLTVAHAEVMVALRKMKVCAEANEWPGLPAGITPLSTPPWKVYQVRDALLTAPQDAKTIRT